MSPVNERDVEWEETERGDARWRRKRLSEAADGEGLECSLYELPAGATSFPYHYHTAKPEAMYVLAGEGTLRLAGERHPIRPGAYVPFPADERGAHRVASDGDGPLRYLMVAAENEPDVRIYPDSGKVGVTADTPGDGYYRFDDAVGYWEGE